MDAKDFIKTVLAEKAIGSRTRIIKDYIKSSTRYNDLVPYLPLLVTAYYDFNRVIDSSIDAFPASIISDWFGMGTYSSEFVDALNKAIYNTLLISYSPQEATDIIKRSTIALTNANISNDLLEKLRYDVPYGSFADEEELHNYETMYPDLFNRQYYVQSSRRPEIRSYMAGNKSNGMRTIIIGPQHK